MKTVDVYIEKCREDVELPKYAKQGDAGMDIRAAEDVVIFPSETKIIPTGIKVAIPEGYEIQVRPRSGLSYNTPLRISNSPGTIDCGFRDEIGIIVENTSKVNENELYNSCDLYTKNNIPGVYTIKKGDRIAQIVLNEVPTINFISVDSVKDIGNDRKSGFGGTGVE